MSTLKQSYSQFCYWQLLSKQRSFKIFPAVIVFLISVWGSFFIYFLSFLFSIVFLCIWEFGLYFRTIHSDADLNCYLFVHVHMFLFFLFCEKCWLIQYCVSIEPPLISLYVAGNGSRCLLKCMKCNIKNRVCTILMSFDVNIFLQHSLNPLREAFYHFCKESSGIATQASWRIFQSVLWMLAAFCSALC